MSLLYDADGNRIWSLGQAWLEQPHFAELDRMAKETYEQNIMDSAALRQLLGEPLLYNADGQPIYKTQVWDGRGKYVHV